MQTETRTDRNVYSSPEPMDFTEILEDILRCLKRYWIQLLLVLVAAAAVTVAYLNASYKPVYSAKVTYAVNKTGMTENDAALAKRLSSSVAKIYGTYEFQDELFDSIQEKSLDPGKCWISTQYTEGANLFTVTVSSNDFRNVDPVLEAFQQVYPRWADKSNGSVELETVDRVQASQIPDNPYSMIDCAVKGLLVGLVLVAALTFLYAQTLHTVRKEKDMKKVTSKGCIALIPDTKMKKRTNENKSHLLISNKRIDWSFKQSMLSAQSRLDQIMSRQEQKVLLVTSTLPQEGKSLMSVNLALAAVQNGKKTVIIDGDLRNPSVGRVFGFEGKTLGLSDFFDRKADPDEIITRSGELAVIGGGTRTGGVSGIISDEMMEDLMGYLRRVYDFIVIDTPPSGLFSDAAILEKYADTCLYVVRQDMATLHEIQEGIAPFIIENKLAGYLINRSSSSISSYGKYGKYGYSKYGHYGKYKRYIKTTETSMNTEDTL
ncbi:MAG: CpsD/CapB family tyrosine-protein kinase [Blautia sp.]|uniref:CpsD/CapB family tyrosine-protein kinase n=1 Tax=Blautia sp. TaxID=1955243 RepID=UPI002A750FFD|nr:CpsD/CapB family tyrosine-protein kinase [Blautia sp.]MDY3016764.1 CpsD/CapB family tyrosine-protein kinase [Blautia sp.]